MAIFQVNPVLIEAKDDGGGGDNWSYKSCKAPVTSSPPTNQHPVFTGRMPFLSPKQQCQSTEGKNITFRGLAYPKLTWGLPTLSSLYCADVPLSNYSLTHSLTQLCPWTTNSSWLPWRRVAMPLIGPLIPVPVKQKPKLVVVITVVSLVQTVFVNSQSLSVFEDMQ